VFIKIKKMTLFTHIVFLIGGLALILWGANALTDGAASIAKRFRLSDLVIGLTVIAFGTSAPELAISVLASVEGSPELSIGNVVGSNLFNLLMIVGCTALVAPIHVDRGLMSKEIPLLVLSSLVLLVCANEVWLDGAAVNEVSRSDGLLLLAFFLIFMRYTFSIARNGTEAEGATPVKQMPIWKAVLWVVLGLAALIVGGEGFVDGASGLARTWGVSESVIGLTLVAGGTSLPELATSLVAARKGRPDMAIGNVIGSNLFNVFLVLGCSATVCPLPVGGVGNLDFGMLVGASCALWIVSRFYREQTITRMEGGLLVAAYIAYIYALL
jgi:cation:H+ antiporter